jgi:hypothetical protein
MFIFAANMLLGCLPVPANEMLYLDSLYHYLFLVNAYGFCVPVCQAVVKPIRGYAACYADPDGEGDYSLHHTSVCSGATRLSNDGKACMIATYKDA